MRSVWEAPEFAAVPETPVALGERVAGDLGVPTEPMAELVSLYLVALDSSLAVSLPRLLADQLEWQRTRLHTVAPAVDRLSVVAAVRSELARHLAAADLSAVDRHVQEALRLTEVGSVTPTPTTRLGPRARSYLDLLLRGDRKGAVDLVTTAVDEGVDVADILLGVFQPVQIEIGRLWEEGRVSVAQEHFATAVTQLALSLLYPRLFSGEETGHTLVAVSAGNEAHEVGLRIVTDLLERNGWRTTYLGAAVPVSDVVDQVVDSSADVLAISATMPGHVRHVRRLVDALRADTRTSRVKVIVGGRLFLVAPELVDDLRVDGWAQDAEQAVALCDRLVGAAYAYE